MTHPAEDAKKKKWRWRGEPTSASVLALTAFDLTQPRPYPRLKYVFREQITWNKCGITLPFAALKVTHVIGAHYNCGITIVAMKRLKQQTNQKQTPRTGSYIILHYRILDYRILDYRMLDYSVLDYSILDNGIRDY